MTQLAKTVTVAPADRAFEILDRHRAAVLAWYRTVTDELGHVRLCAEGDLLSPSKTSGLGWAALGLKLCHMLDLFPDLPDGYRENLALRIKGFQQTRGKDQGWFTDKALLEAVDRWRYRILRDRNMPVRVAESRQAMTALLSVDEMPDRPLPMPADTTSGIDAHVRNLPWAKNPWGAGSHWSHLMVFLAIRTVQQAVPPMSDPLIDHGFRAIEPFFSEETGSWHEGVPSSSQVLNAAMKVYTAHDFIGRPPPSPERMIDYLLNAVVAEGGCNHVDALYVAETALRHTDHRREELEHFAAEAVLCAEDYRQPDGGMSFHLDRTQTGYYGMAVSRGLPGIADLHGTKLLTWSLVLAAGILGRRDALGWRLPIA
ncbi:MAG: hypothetical protein OEU92_16660 [Alphaproteobacteria bacterium]|nr:hypothetical protein [Alphaproteobacteria bacterium]